MLLDNDLGNKLNAEVLLRKEFENFDPIMDLMEVGLVDSIRPEIQSSQDGAVVLRYVYVIKYSKDKYYKKFLPRINTLFDQISTERPRIRSTPFKVAKVDIYPHTNNGKAWRAHSVAGFYLINQVDGRTAWEGKPKTMISMVQKISRGGVASLREWVLSEHLAAVYHECMAVQRGVNCVLTRLSTFE